MKSLFLFLLAVIPALALCIFVYRKDRTEKEPLYLLFKLFFLGALITVPVAIIEGITTPAVNGIFAPYGDEASMPFAIYVFYQFIYNTFGVALVEEGVKWWVLTRATKNLSCFDSLFDGVIYSVFVSLGFAALENIMYVFGSDSFSQGFAVACARFFTSVPGHMFFSISMGYYYSMWRIYEIARQCENAYVKYGIVRKKFPAFDGGKWLAKSLVCPTAIHGLWDFLCSNRFSPLWLYAFIVILYIIGFFRISRISKKDNFNRSIALGLTIKKYPELREYFASLNSAVTARSIINGEHFNNE